MYVFLCYLLYFVYYINKYGFIEAPYRVVDKSDANYLVSHA